MENSNENEFNLRFIHGIDMLGYDKTKRRGRRETWKKLRIRKRF
jgi:ssRNA-specific RNase YbeY (16S rRNA maturation enzyme)